MASSKEDPDIVIRITRNFENIDFSPSRLEEVAKAVCKLFAPSRAPHTGYEISIAVVGDAEIRRLNTQFLNHRNTTDCLSFDLSDHEDSKVENRGPIVFELVVNGEMAVREANSRGHSSEAELALYVTHGLLHNLGFDDSTPKQARTMHDTEDDILQQMGYGFVYNKRTRSPEHESTDNP